MGCTILYNSIKVIQTLFPVYLTTTCRRVISVIVPQGNICVAAGSDNIDSMHIDNRSSICFYFARLKNNVNCRKGLDK